ncbi:hypothetical protein A2483_05880 [Candidatus Peregrinibacteria bacterium RIFOXYC2_FULL_33_13]|nr:MAG: hypothetical protein A2483_05880 [Candidatus Peregrinibacteria bacterium RIFOXYC2_FULL_33_13]
MAHSFGGRIAIKIAAESPVKLKHLILTGAAGIKDKNNLKKNIFKILAKTGNAFFSLPIISKMEKSARKILYRLSKGYDYLKLTDPIMKKTFQLIVEENLTNLLHKINIPTLLLWGREDTLTPVSHAKIMHEKIKNSQIIIYDNIGHRLPYAMPDEFAEQVEKWFYKK